MSYSGLDGGPYKPPTGSVPSTPLNPLDMSICTTPRPFEQKGRVSGGQDTRPAVTAAFDPQIDIEE